MFFSKKSLIILLVFTVVISVAANVYSFGNRSEVSNGLRGKINQYESESKEKDKTISELKLQISNLKKSDTGIVENEKSNEEANGNDQDNHEDKIINTAYRFIEYAFDSNPETYVSRKKMAREYMTDDLFETLYSADGVDEYKQNLITEVERMNVYLNPENENEAIVHYVLNEEIPSSGYKETIEKYVTLKFISKNNQLKVSRIDSINNDEGGI